MPCDHTRSGDVHVITCGRGVRKRCQEPGCDRHRQAVAGRKNTDLCPAHARHGWPGQEKEATP